MYHAFVLAQTDATTPPPEVPPAAADTAAQTKQEPTSATDAAPDDRPGGFPANMWIPLILIIALMYFLLFRPQRKQEKKRQEMLSQISKNDHVVTIGGIAGIVYSVGESDVVLKVDERNDVRIRVLKSAIARVVTEDEQKAEAARKPGE